jgi:hypothetical protein
MSNILICEGEYITRGCKDGEDTYGAHHKSCAPLERRKYFFVVVEFERQQTMRISKQVVAE